MLIIFATKNLKHCLIALWTAVLLWTVAPMTTVACQAAPLPAPLTPYQVIDAVNQSRTSFGLPALIVDPILMGTAQATADTMAGSQIHGHIGNVKERVMAAGYGGGGVAFATENFVVLRPEEGQDRIMQAWADEQHMYPMVNPNYKHVGAGVAVSEAEGLVYYILHAAYGSGGNYKPNQPPGPGTSTAVTASQYIYAVQTVTPQADGSLIHIVQAGQSLWSIAIAYETHINELQRLNGYASDNTTVFTGQKLLVPTNPGGYPTALSATPEFEQSKIEISPTASRERPLTSTPTVRDIPAEASSTPAIPQAEKGSTQAIAIIIIVIFLFGASLVATGSLWKKSQ